MKRWQRLISLGIIIFAVFFFFYPVILQKNLPIPSDTIIGLYHPFRDFYAKEYPNGIPYRNFLITDPVRQQYPWRNLVIESVKRMEFPLWNPYNFSGTPLLANIQSASFYPGNMLFFLFPFSFAWSVLIISQPLFAALFLYIYLRNLRISREGSILGAISFAFSGFFIAWLEWGTVLHVALWLPLILYCIDGIFLYSLQENRSVYRNKIFFNSLLFLISLCFAFFAGHLQTFFYLSIFVFCYIIARFLQYKKHLVYLIPFVIVAVCFFILTFFQWYTTIQLILQSARDIDQADWTKVGWFIPWQHIIQFIAPDFFGNPASLNYWSDWNYAEFVGYIGIVPLLMALLALFFRRDKKTLFFGAVFFLSILFAFPTPLAKLPFIFSLPFISTAQPTRLLFLIDFSLAVLAAFGIDYFAKHTKKIIYPLIGLLVIFGLLWMFILVGHIMIPQVSLDNIAIAKRNLMLPSLLIAITSFSCILGIVFSKARSIHFISYIFIAITLFDLLRFGMKFTPFTSQAYLFPQTSSIEFLQKQKGQFRIMTTDSEILPPNFSSMYHIQSVDGYDPIYLRRYAEVIAASERNKPDITPPFGFNRIITPHNYNSQIIDLLNVRYVISLSDQSSHKLKKVFQEGKTQIYENKKALPRAFFVSTVQKQTNKQKIIEALLNKSIDLHITAFTDDEQFRQVQKPYGIGSASITKYSANKVVIQTNNKQEGFLVVTDIFYPTWKAGIYKNNTLIKNLDIIRTDYLFRGIIVPAGNNTIVLYQSIL